MRTILAAFVFSGALHAQQFEKPIRLKAGGKIIQVDAGHAAPYVCDWNRDGKRDLLVGQFGGGKLRIYLNDGTNDRPAYRTPVWFRAGGVVASVPVG